MFVCFYDINYSEELNQTSQFFGLGSKINAPFRIPSSWTINWTNWQKQIDQPLTDKKNQLSQNLTSLIVQAHLRYDANVLFNNLLFSLFVLDIID